MTCVETGGGSSAQDADTAGGTRDIPRDGTESINASHVRTHGPFVIRLTQTNDHECCSPSMMLLSEIESGGVEGETVDAKKGTSDQEVGTLSSRFLLACNC